MATKPVFPIRESLLKLGHRAIRTAEEASLIWSFAKVPGYWAIVESQLGDNYSVDEDMLETVPRLTGWLIESLEIISDGSTREALRFATPMPAKIGHKSAESYVEAALNYALGAIAQVHRSSRAWELSMGLYNCADLSGQVIRLVDLLRSCLLDQDVAIRDFCASIQTQGADEYVEGSSSEFSIAADGVDLLIRKELQRCLNSPIPGAIGHDCYDSDLHQLDGDSDPGNIQRKTLRVIDLLERGLDRGSIAERLGITPNNVSKIKHRYAHLLKK